MGLNKVMLLGNLGADPELRYTQSQTPVCTLKLATNERRKTPEGEWVDHTEWHTVVVWRKQAENCAQYLSKGRQVFIEGKLQTRKWQDKEGRDRYTTEVVAQTVEFVGGGRGEGSGRSSGASSGGGTAFDTGGFSAQQESTNVGFDDDDIPF